MFNENVLHAGRNFRFYQFSDNNDQACTIQKSSSALNDCIWLGLESASPKALHGDATKLGVNHNETCGWVDFPIPEEVSLNTRMHLTRDQAKKLGEMLLWFADVGELPLIPEITEDVFTI